MSHTSDHTELLELAAAEADGSITESQHARLAELLIASADARAAYLQYRRLHAALDWRTGADNAELGPRIDQPTNKPAPSIPIYRKGHEPKSANSLSLRERAGVRPNFKHNPALLAVAATLLAACGVAIYVYFASLPHSELRDPTSDPPVATLIESTPGSTLTTPGGFISEGRDYPRGEYTLDSGTAEFMLTNSVNVKLRGDTRLVMHNDMHVSLTSGSAEFVVPREAQGFTVNLPDGTKVIDLGTRFRIAINRDGVADIRVQEGRVRIERRDASVLLDAGRRALASSDPLQPIDVLSDPLPIATYDFDDPANRSFDASENGHDAESNVAEYVLDKERGSDAMVLDYRRRLRVPVGCETGFTFAAWIKSEAGHYLVDTRAGATDAEADQFVLGIGYNSADTIGFWDRESIWHFDQSGPDLTDGRWHHVAWAYDTSGSIAMYIDGVLALRDAVTPGMKLPPGFTVGLFVQPKKVGRIFTARIDDIRLYELPLDAEQIAAIAADTGQTESTTSAREPADRSRRHRAADVPPSEE